MKTNKKRLLHVDDDPAILRLVAAQLKQFGFDVVSCDDPSQALGIVARENLRVVLLDIDMPQMSGLTLLSRLKEYDGGLQVVVLSGLVSITTALDSMRAGAEYCLFKPVRNIEPVAEALKKTFTKLEQWRKSLVELRKMQTTEDAFC